VAGHHGDASIGDGGQDTVAGGDGGGQRLFQHDVLAGIGGVVGDGGVGVVRGGDHHGLHRGVGEKGAVVAIGRAAMLGGEGGESVRVWPADCGKAKAGGGGDGAGVGGPDEAGADDADADHGRPGIV
jgi:hypothetical protein